MNKSEITSVLIVVLFIFTIFSFTNNIIDINGELSKAMWVNRFCMFVASILTISYFVKKNGHNVSFLLKNRFFLIIAVSLVIQLTLLRVEKVPQIDVFDVLRWGPEQLLSGKNPYETAATVPGLSDSDFKYRHFAYGPAAIYLFLPFDAILKEPRYLLIIANFLTAFSLYVIGKNCWRDKKIGEIFALIYLFNPRLVYFLSFSWTDGLIVSLIALGAFSLHKKREGGFATSLGLISSIKIFYILPLLFFLKYKPLSKIKVLTLWFIFTAILHLPFLVNNWQAMYKSIIEINTGGEFFAQLQRFSLTFATLIDRQFHIYPPKSFFPIAATVITIFFWLIFKSTIDVSRLFLSVTLVFIVLIFFGPIANANYYFTASSLVLFALAFSGVKIKMAKTVLVSGCAGFIGSSLVDQLLDTEYKVVGIDNFNTYYDAQIKRRNIESARKHKNFKLYERDILNLGELEKIFRIEKFDKVIHLAARAGVRPSINDPLLYAEINVLGTVNLLKLSVDFGIKQFIFGSSSSVYGSSKSFPFSEEDNCEHIISPYGASKRAAEFWVESFHKMYGLRSTILRFFTVYGPRSRPDMAPALFTKAILKGRSIDQFGDGLSSRDYTYIDDVVDGILRCLDKNFDFEIINLGNNHPVSLNDFVKTLEKVLGKKARVKHLPRQSGDVIKTCANINKAKDILGWQPRVKFIDGMKKTYEYFSKF